MKKFLVVCLLMNPALSKVLCSTTIPPVKSYGIAQQNQTIDEVNKLIFGISSYEQVIPTIEKIETLAVGKYKSEPVVRLYAAVLSPLKHMEGIVYRLGRVISSSDIIFVMVTNYLREIAYRQHLYGPHIAHFLEFITTPPKKALNPTGKATKFSKISDIQDFLSDTTENGFGRALQKSEYTIAHMINKENDKFHFLFDTQLATGVGDFLAPNKLKLTVVPADISLLFANIKNLRANINIFCSYNLDAAISLVNKLAKKTSINSMYRVVEGFFVRNYESRRTKLQTPQELAEELGKKEYKNFLTPRKNAAAMLHNALIQTYEAIKWEQQWLESVLLGAANLTPDVAVKFLSNPLLIYPVEAEKKATLQLKLDLFSGKEKAFVSEVTGKTVAIDVAKLYEVKEDLKKFFPTSFVKGKDFYKVNGHKKFFYSRGRPTAWSDPTFGGFLPGATNDNLYDIARTLSLTDATSNFLTMLPIPGLVKSAVFPNF